MAVVAAWHLYAASIHDPDTVVHGVTAPALMFAGEDGDYKDCCMIDKTRAIGAAAASAGAPIELVTYPRASHDFIFPGKQFDAGASFDSWQRAGAALAKYLPH